MAQKHQKRTTLIHNIEDRGETMVVFQKIWRMSIQVRLVYMYQNLEDTINGAI